MRIQRKTRGPARRYAVKLLRPCRVRGRRAEAGEVYLLPGAEADNVIRAGAGHLYAGDETPREPPPFPAPARADTARRERLEEFARARG